MSPSRSRFNPFARSDDGIRIRWVDGRSASGARVFALCSELTISWRRRFTVKIAACVRSCLMSGRLFSGRCFPVMWGLACSGHGEDDQAPGRRAWISLCMRASRSRFSLRFNSQARRLRKRNAIKGVKARPVADQYAAA